jgi:hypothetical protein
MCSTSEEYWSGTPQVNNSVQIVKKLHDIGVEAEVIEDGWVAMVTWHKFPNFCTALRLNTTVLAKLQEDSTKLEEVVNKQHGYHEGDSYLADVCNTDPYAIVGSSPEMVTTENAFDQHLSDREWYVCLSRI